MRAAVERVLAGEKVADVARALGLNGQRLGGAVSGRRRWAKPAGEPAPLPVVPAPVAAAPAERPRAAGEDACTACGLPMIVTVEHPDLCRKCRP